MGRSGGGLAIAVNNTWSSASINLSGFSSINEFMGVRCFLRSSQLNIINIYSGSGLVVPDIIKSVELLMTQLLSWVILTFTINSGAPRCRLGPVRPSWIGFIAPFASSTLLFQLMSPLVGSVP